MWTKCRAPVSLVGAIHALVGLAVHSIGYVTNGSIRDVPAVKTLGFQLFASRVAVSHMYAHICEYRSPVEIGGLTIRPGDLIHGDRHGVQIIPLSIASEIPAMVSEMSEEEREIKKLCQSPEFSLEKLAEQLEDLPGDGFEVRLGDR